MVEFCPDCSNLLHGKIIEGRRYYFCKCGYKRVLDSELTQNILKSQPYMEKKEYQQHKQTQTTYINVPLPNVDKIRIMRNAINHANVKFPMDGEWETYQICFIDQKKRVKRTINEFIIDYFKLIKFIFTLELVCKIFELKIKYPNKSLSELLVKGFEKVLPISLEELRKPYLLTTEDVSKMILKVLVIFLNFIK